MKTVVAVFVYILFLFYSCQSRFQISSTPAVTNLDVSSQTPDSSIVNLILPFSKKYDSTMNDVVGYVGENLEKGYPEGKLGNAVADIFYEFTFPACGFNESNSFVLINNGGLRTSWAKGTITRSLVFELMPFENEFAVIEIQGKYLLTGMAEYIFAKKGQPVSRNMQIKFKAGKLIEMKLNGKEIIDDKSYFIITSDYLAAGGDKMEFFKNGKPKETPIKGIKLRDMLLRGMKELTSYDKPLVTTNPGRIVIE